MLQLVHACSTKPWTMDRATTGEDLVLATERLRLRMVRQSDFDDLYAMFNDPEVMRYYPAMRDRTETQAWIDYMLQDRYPKHGMGMWTVELKNSDDFAGQCGLMLQRVDDEQHVEIGYIFARRFWHQGYATEAAKGCKTYAFERLSLPYVVSLIRPVNMPSRRVAERNGMAIWKSTIFHGFESFVYRVNADGSTIFASS